MRKPTWRVIAGLIVLAFWAAQIPPAAAAERDAGGLQREAEALAVRRESGQAPALVPHGVHGADGGGPFVAAVEERNNRALVGDAYVESVEPAQARQGGAQLLRGHVRRAVARFCAAEREQARMKERRHGVPHRMGDQAVISLAHKDTLPKG